MTLIECALKEYGISGYPGAETNANILRYFHDIGHSWVLDDETPWCAAFLNYVLMKANLPHTGKLNARSFLEIGTPVNDPIMGDLVVFWRISKISSYGHCGIFIAKVGHLVYTLGGNEDNSVKIKGYSDDQVLGYRRV